MYDFNCINYVLYRPETGYDQRLSTQCGIQYKASLNGNKESPPSSTCVPGPSLSVGE